MITFIDGCAGGIKMEKINIICVDDDREILEAVNRDLSFFSEMFTIEECQSAEQCEQLLETFDAQQEYVALIISGHFLPIKSGVALLTEVATDSRFIGTKKILLTGHATQADTIKAINSAKVDGFLAKTWDSDELIQMVKELLTQFILEKGIDYEPFIKKLDAPTLYRLLKS